MWSLLKFQENVNVRQDTKVEIVRFLVREVAMVLVVRIVVIASMQTLRGVIMLQGSAFVTLDGEVRHINTICNV